MRSPFWYPADWGPSRLRGYFNWGHYEAANNFYKWDNVKFGEHLHFVVVSENRTNSLVQSSEGFGLSGYFNPGHNQMEISLLVPERQKVNLWANTLEDKLIKKKW